MFGSRRVGRGKEVNELHRAAEAGDYELAGRILKEHPEWINRPNPEGWTPMHIACDKGHSHVVVQLMLSGAMLDAADKDGTNPYHLAAMNGHEQIVDMLAGGIASTSTNDSGENALHMAASKGQNKIVNILLKKTHLVRETGTMKFTALHYACRDNQLSTVQLLATRHPKLLTKVDEEGYTPLHLAAFNAREEIAKWLLEKRPKLVTLTDEDGETVLHHCVSTLGAGTNMSVPFIKQVYEMYPQALRSGNKHGNTPFHDAIANNKKEIIEMLQWYLGIDEIADSFAFCKKSFDTTMWPVIEAQCEPLLTSLNRDVVGTIFQYLGLSSRKRQRSDDNNDNNDNHDNNDNNHDSDHDNDNDNDNVAMHVAG